MLKKLNDANMYIDFVNEINSDSDFYEPMLSSDEQMQCNLLNASSKSNSHIFGVFDEEEIIGLFVFLILKDELYIEMLVGLSKSQKAYDEMLSYLKKEFKGYNADFVYSPNNYLLHNKLQDEKADFEVEQQKMIHKKDVLHYSNYQVELYSPKYKEQYIAIHSKDGYWTADKVIDALDRFRIILAIENDEVVGYLDITYKYEENELYDVFVKNEYRKKGYAKAMLAKAIELNKPHDMMLLVDIDGVAAIALYESLGFVKAVGENNMTAHILL